MNVTRAEAQARARLLDVEGYDVVLDLTIGDVTFGSTTTARFRCTEPGAETFVDLVADRIDEITLNGHALDPATVFDGTRITLTDLAADNELRGAGELPLHAHGRGAAPLRRPGRQVRLRVHAVRGRRLAPGVHRLRAARPEGDLRVHRHGARRLGGRLQPADAASPSRSDWATPPGCSRRPSALSSYITALVAGPYHRVDGEYRVGDRVVPLGVFCRTSLAAHLDTDDDPRGDPAGLRVLRGGLRHALPVREVRPAVRAGVQLGRDGERRLRDPERGLRLPVPGAGGVLRAACGDDPARARAHVVRRPGHDDLVGRPVAERVVRRVGQHAGGRGGDPVGLGLDHLRQHRQDLGLPAGPAALDAPDRGRDPRPRGRRGQLRRHHLRQGRLGAQAAGGVGRAGRLPGRDPAVLPHLRLGQHDAGRPPGQARGDVRPGPQGLVGRVAGDRRRQHPASRDRDRRRRAVHVVHHRAERTGRVADAALAPAGHRPVRPDRRRPGAPATGSSWTCSVPAPRSRSSSGSRSRTSSWSTTTT